MSETSENPAAGTPTATAPAPATTPALYKIPKVFIAAAWVAIVAGIVFIVSVIFFTGMALGRHGGGHHHHHKHHAAWMHSHRMGGPGGPGAVQQGGPSAGTPGAPGPSQVPSSVAPSRTP